MHARLALGFKAAHHGSAAGQHGQRRAKGLGQRTDQHNVGSRCILKTQRSAAALAQGLFRARRMPQDAEGLGVVQNQQPTPVPDDFEVVGNRRRLSAARAKAVRHHHRPQPLRGAVMQHPSQGFAVVVRKDLHRNLACGGALHAPAADRVDPGVHVDRTAPVQHAEQVPKQVQRRSAQRRLLTTRQAGQCVGQRQLTRRRVQLCRLAGGELLPGRKGAARMAQAEVERRGEVCHGPGRS